MSKEDSTPVATPHHFYVNITLLNKEEVVASKIQEKTGTGIFGKVAGKVANAGVSDDKVIGKLSEGLCSALPQTLAQMGIDGTFEQVFQQNTFVVFKCNIVELDNMKLLKGAKGEDFARTFQTMLDCFATIGVESAAANVSSTIQTKVRAGMMEKLGAILPTKMAENGMKISCAILSPENQADFFFPYLASLVE